MFENTKRIIEYIEKTVDKAKHNPSEITIEEQDFICDFADIYLAKALMKDWSGAETIAKFILAAINQESKYREHEKHLEALCKAGEGALCESNMFSFTPNINKKPHTKLAGDCSGLTIPELLANVDE